MRTYTYDNAGQLTRLTDSHTGVSQYVYDGLGRRVQHTDHTGAVTTYAYSPVGLLAEITGKNQEAVRLWNDALGQVAAVVTGGTGTGETSTDTESPTMCSLTWDPTSFTPTLLGANNTPIPLSTTASLDILGGRGVNPFELSPVIAGFTTSSTGVGVGSADTQGLFDTLPNSIPGAPGLGLTHAGSVQVAGLEILGARAYDATTRGFMTPDPLASPTGAGWAANVYAFAGHDPVSQVDPWGLSAMTATEFANYRAETHAAQANRSGGVLDAIAKHAPGFEMVSALGNKVQGVMNTVKDVAHASFESAKHIAKDTVNNVKDWANEHSEIIAGIAIVAGATITAAALAATGPAALIILGAVGNGLISGGASIFTNKNQDGTVDWTAVFKDALIGTASGAVGGTAVSAISKIGTALNTSRAMGTSVSATNAFIKSENLAARSASASRINPMRYINSYRSASSAQKAERLYTSASKYSQTAAHYADVGGFARSMTGQTAQSVATNVTSNNLAYANGDFKEHTVGGYARATASGIGVGVISPRITPLRESHIMGAAPEGAPVLKAVSQDFLGQGVDRLGDGALGVGNYLVTPQDKDLSPEEAGKEFFKGAMGGGAGSSSSGTADVLRPATPKP